MPRKVRNYKEEYRKFHSSPKAKKDRAARNKAKSTKKCSGDVHHKDGNPRNNTSGNLVCSTRKKNRADGARKVSKASKAKGGRR